MYKEIASDLQEIFFNGSYSDSWPIGSALAADLIVEKFSDDLITYLKTNPKIYPLEVSDFFLMLNPRTVDFIKKQETMKYLFKYIVKSRKDILFKSSLDITNPPVIKNDELIYSKDYNKIIFLLSNLSEIYNPIFRRLNHDIYTYNNLLYRYYRLKKEYLIIARIIKNPRITFFGHLLESEKIEKYNCYINNKLVLPDVFKKSLIEDLNLKNKELRFKTDSEKLLYVLNSCRLHIGLSKLDSIDFKYNKTEYIISDEQKNLALQNKEKSLDSAEKKYFSLLGDYNDYR